MKTPRSRIEDRSGGEGSRDSKPGSGSEGVRGYAEIPAVRPTFPSPEHESSMGGGDRGDDSASWTHRTWNALRSRIARSGLDADSMAGGADDSSLSLASDSSMGDSRRVRGAAVSDSTIGTRFREKAPTWFRVARELPEEDSIRLGPRRPGLESGSEVGRARTGSFSDSGSRTPAVRVSAHRGPLREELPLRMDGSGGEVRISVSGFGDGETGDGVSGVGGASAPGRGNRRRGGSPRSRRWERAARIAALTTGLGVLGLVAAAIAGDGPESIGAGAGASPVARGDGGGDASSGSASTSSPAPTSAPNPGREVARLLSRGDAAGALRALEEGEAFPGSDWLRARALFELKRDAEAVEALDAILAANPDDLSARRLRGKAWYRLGRHDRALADYDRIAATSPTESWSAEFSHDRGSARLMAGDAAGAIEDFGRALERQPDRRSARHARALARLMTGDAAGASEDVERALRDDPEDAVALRLKRRLQAAGAVPGAGAS